MNNKMKPVRLQEVRKLWEKIKNNCTAYEGVVRMEAWMERLLKYYQEKLELKERVIKQQSLVLDDYRRQMINLELENDRLRKSNNDFKNK